MLKSITSKPAPFIIVHCLVWWAMTVIAKPILDSYGDMIEVYAWSQHWLAGSDKHPQFLPWLTNIWFLVAPQSFASFYLLSALNLAVALFGIMALGRALKLGEMQVLVALALSTLALPYLTLPGKLNMNAICLATWPWTAWAFVRAVSEPQKLRLLYAALFGLLAALSVLGKYYSVVLLIPLFAYTLMPRQLWLWKTGAPWLAIVVFLAALTPHLIWLAEHREALAYASEQGAGDDLGRAIYYIAKFAVAPLFYWPLPLLLACLLFVSGSLLARGRKLLRWPQAMPLLGVSALGPWLVTLLFAFAGLAELSTPWAIPIGFAFTLYLVANAEPKLLERNGPKLMRAFHVFWPALIAGAIVLAAIRGQAAETDYYMPDEEAAVAAVEHWHSKHEMPLSWVASGKGAAFISFFSPRPIEALPGLPNGLPSYYPARENWQAEAGMMLCSLLPAGNVDGTCLQNIRDWAAANNMQSEEAVLTVKRSGLQFPREVPFDLTVVYVWPK